MELWLIIGFIVGLIVGGAIVLCICWKSMRDSRKAARSYFDMYMEVNQALADLVIFEKDLDEDLVENQTKLL